MYPGWACYLVNTQGKVVVLKPNLQVWILQTQRWTLPSMFLDAQLILVPCMPLIAQYHYYQDIWISPTFIQWSNRFDVIVSFLAQVWDRGIQNHCMGEFAKSQGWSGNAKTWGFLFIKLEYILNFLVWFVSLFELKFVSKILHSPM